MVIHKDDELSDSELLDMLEQDIENEDAFMAGYREQRLEQMKREYVNAENNASNADMGLRSYVPPNLQT